MLWSFLASAAFHLIVLALIFGPLARFFIVRGTREIVAQTTVVSIERRPRQASQRPRAVRRAPQRESAPATTPHRELAKAVTTKAPRLPPRRPRIATSNIERDEAGFAKEIAQLNRSDDPDAIPTIDPGSRESSTKAYSFAVPAPGSDEHGNGIITPTRRWTVRSLDCYYGRYEFTYPDGAMEEGAIVWPFCYDAASDPFNQPPHTIPFPFPLPGFKLPPGSQLPPIEKSVYEEWAASNGASSP